MIILADVGNVAGEARDRLAAWVEDGGMLVRFAGPRLAGSDDDLVPVKLRRGGRILGGSLSWDQPQQLAAFSREGPFGNMAVPNDVTVTRQVLAEPEAGLIDRTWATLADGTPLVTAVKRGKGMIVLFHVTADTRWSDLPLSGAFVDMLRRIVGLAGTSASGRERRTTAARCARWCRRPACSTASARSGRRRRPRGRCPPAMPRAPPPIIRRASTARRRDCSRSTRWRRPIGWPRSTIRSSTRGSRPIRSASRRTCAARCCWRRWRCSRSTRMVVFFLAGGFAQMFRGRPRRAAAAMLAARSPPAAC